MGDNHIAQRITRAANMPSYNTTNAMSSRWEADEDDKLRSAIALHGTQWRAVADMVPGRNDAQCRNRYLRMCAVPTLKKDGRPPNRCQICGQVYKGHACTGRVNLEVQLQRKRPREEAQVVCTSDLEAGVKELCWTLAEVEAVFGESM